MAGSRTSTPHWIRPIWSRPSGCLNGNEQFTTFLSERMDFDKSYHHLLFNQDYTSFAIK